MTIVTTLLTRWEFYLTLFIIFAISRIISWLTDPLRKIPGPLGYPIIGNILDYSPSKDLNKVLLERERKYGTVYKDFTFRGGTVIHVSDPEFAKWLLVTNSSNYGRDDSLLRLLPALGTGLLTTNGKEHSSMRKNLNPMFTHGSVKQFISVFNDKAKQLVMYIEEKIKENKGSSIEMKMLQKLSDLTLDVIGVCAFGYNFDGILGGSSEEGRATNTILTANFNVIRKLLEQLIPLLKLIPSKERDELKKAEDVFYGLIKKVIAARKQEIESHPGETMEKPDLLQKLISMYDEAGLTFFTRFSHS